jgi:ABC-2 type transport system permease protein
LTHALRIFLVGGLISYRALFGFLHPAVFIPTLLVVPIFQVLLFTYIGRTTGVQDDEFYVIGNALHSAATPGLWAMTQAVAASASSRHSATSSARPRRASRSSSGGRCRWSRTASSSRSGRSPRAPPSSA